MSAAIVIFAIIGAFALALLPWLKDGAAVAHAIVVAAAMACVTALLIAGAA